MRPGARILRETAWLFPVLLPVTAAGAALAGTASVAVAAAPPDGAALLGLLALLVAATLAESLPVPIEGVHVGATSLANIFIVGASVIYGWAPGVLLGFTSMVLVEVARRRRPLRIAYNGALYTLAAGAAGAAGAVVPDEGRLDSLLITAVLGSFAFYGADLGLLAAIVSRSQRQPFTPLLVHYVRWTVVPFAIMASVTVLLVAIWDRSALLALALVGPLVAVALYQRSVHEALEAMRLALTDPLTELGNHRAFHERLETELAAAHAEGSPLSVCVIDVDNFKAINDTHGHPVGDAVLAEIAGQLRKSGEAFRVGGDEFALVLRGCDERGALAIGEAVVERIVAHDYPHGTVPSISAGIATAPRHAHDREELFRLADKALYSSKQGGKNRACVYEPDLSELPGLQQLAEGPDRAARLRAAASLARAVDARDTYTGSHSYMVGQLAARIAVRMELPPEEVELTRLAGQLHDLGKLAIPEEILRKPGPLTAAERLVIERHPQIGFRMLDSLGIEPVASWVLHHHERWDGGGYPGGLRGTEIPLGSRIILVADAYDAMTSDRVYRGRLSSRHAIRELERCAGSQFDPEVVAAFRIDVGAQVRPLRSA